MDRHFVHKTMGRVCAKDVSFDYVDGHVFNVEFNGGCRGNTTGVALLAEGMTPQAIIRRLKGVDCHGGNSCPNELAMAMEELLAEQEENT
ncbi:MAG: TSCPD domain-containing protein [Candidatus Spyradocola sp.]